MINLTWLDDSDLSPKAVRLLVRYVTEATGGRVRARLGATARACHMSTGSVQAAEEELIDAGLLEPRGRRCFRLTLPAEAVPVTQGRGWEVHM